LDRSIIPAIKNIKTLSPTVGSRRSSRLIISKALQRRVRGLSRDY
jgi:hypothetical protein